MITVIGLGNPGDEYINTRHNTGRIILEMIAKREDFSEWKDDMKSKALISSGKLGKSKFMFVAPETFMNNSGKSAKAFVESKKDLTNLVVVYDDMDLPLGRVKISFDRSSGGHNGVESIIKSVKSQEFVRIRVGISPHTPKGVTKKPSGEKAVLDFLLKDFKEPEVAELKKISKMITAALEVFASDGKDKMMTQFN